MALGNPIEAFIAAGQAQDKNRQQMLQDISGLGQGFNQMGEAIGQMRKQKILQQLVQAMKTNGAPQQGPQLPGGGMPGMPQPNSGMGAPPQNNMNNITALMTQLDPQSGMKMFSDQQNMAPAFMGPNGQISGMQKPGFQPFGRVDRGDLLKGLATQNEKGASLDERKRHDMEAEDTKKLQLQITSLLAQGRLDEAKAAIEQRKQAAEDRKQQALMQAQLRAQSENAKHPIMNFFRSMRGKGPVIPVPGMDDSSGGDIQVTNFKVH